MDFGKVKKVKEKINEVSDYLKERKKCDTPSQPSSGLLKTYIEPCNYLTYFGFRIRKNEQNEITAFRKETVFSYLFVISKEDISFHLTLNGIELISFYNDKVNSDSEDSKISGVLSEILVLIKNISAYSEYSTFENSQDNFKFMEVTLENNLKFSGYVSKIHPISHTDDFWIYKVIDDEYYYYPDFPPLYLASS